MGGAHPQRTINKEKTKQNGNNVPSSHQRRNQR